MYICAGRVRSALVHATLGESIIANAPADAKTRNAWLERLFDAYQEDDIPYIERLGDHRGALSASKEVASAWVDRLIDNPAMQSP
jgi:hypothetical protein